MDQKSRDPVIEEIREIRHGISAYVDHDPERLVAYYIELQKQYRGRLINAPEAEEAVVPAGTDSSGHSVCGGPSASGSV